MWLCFPGTKVGTAAGPGTVALFKGYVNGLSENVLRKKVKKYIYMKKCKNFVL
jgi:hypothetical protein